MDRLAQQLRDIGIILLVGDVAGAEAVPEVSAALQAGICRDEFCFNGCYITDYTTSMKGKGSDMYLAAGGNPVHATAEQTLSDVKSGWCRALIRDAVHSILYNTANSLAMNGIEGGTKPGAGSVSSGFPIYKIALFAFDALVVLLLLFGMFKVYSKCCMTEERTASASSGSCWRCSS